MKTRPNARVIATASVLVALAGWGGGCASPGGPANASGAASGGQGADARSFYADWYDASAVVLPPPPPAGDKAKK